MIERESDREQTSRDSFDRTKEANQAKEDEGTADEPAADDAVTDEPAADEAASSATSGSSSSSSSSSASAAAAAAAAAAATSPDAMKEDHPPQGNSITPAWIDMSCKVKIRDADLMRCGRTDTGVHAIQQVCSLRCDTLSIDNPVGRLNDLLLPTGIRVFALERVAKSFDARLSSNGRDYEFALPSFCFARGAGDDYRITPEVLAKANEIGSRFVGAHNFHNFTTKVSYTDAFARRIVTKMAIVEPPKVVGKLELVVVQVQGESFMLHQIRKMTAVLVQMVREDSNPDDLELLFAAQKQALPLLPGEGLAMRRCKYDRFNALAETSGGRPVEWTPEVLEEHVQWRNEVLHPHIVELEQQLGMYRTWLETTDPYPLAVAFTAMHRALASVAPRVARVEAALGWRMNETGCAVFGPLLTDAVSTAKQLASPHVYGYLQLEAQEVEVRATAEDFGEQGAPAPVVTGKSIAQHEERAARARADDPDNPETHHTVKVRGRLIAVPSRRCMGLYVLDPSVPTARAAALEQAAAFVAQGRAASASTDDATILAAYEATSGVVRRDGFFRLGAVRSTRYGVAQMIYKAHLLLDVSWSLLGATVLLVDEGVRVEKPGYVHRKMTQEEQEMERRSADHFAPIDEGLNSTTGAGILGETVIGLGNPERSQHKLFYHSTTDVASRKGAAANRGRARSADKRTRRGPNPFRKGSAKRQKQ
uniref:Pseudouridine synthase I TruA alpha/beta domain-containing protein n=1 Tax=Sexangularia sp. CB-2014 TaxID=1486929 RepID=A0A7S1V577_9EUKA